MPFHGPMKYFSRTKWAWVFIVIISNVKVKWYCLNQSFNCLLVWNISLLMLLPHSFLLLFLIPHWKTCNACFMCELCMKYQLLVVLCHFSPTSSCTVLTDLLLECNPSQMSRGWNGATSEMSRWSMFETHFRRTINVMSVIHYLDIFHFTHHFPFHLPCVFSKVFS